MMVLTHIIPKRKKRTPMAGAYAYCIDLDEIVNISTARKTFKSMENPPKDGFRFLCADENCKQPDGKRTQISGVNYKEFPNEVDKVTYKAAHFKVFPRQNHAECCTEKQFEHIENGAKDASGKIITRSTRQKLHDFIDVFDPSIDNDTTVRKTHSVIDGNEREPAATSRATHAETHRNENYSRTRTNQIDRLVDFYLDARAKLANKELTQIEFDSIGLHVKGTNIRVLKDYFRPLKYAGLGNANVVIHGGAKYTPYGKSFRLDFFDEISNLKVNAYFSAEAIEKFRYRQYLRGLLAETAKADYVKVFALGDLRKSSHNGKDFIAFDIDLRHLHLIPAWKKPKTD
jgi:hypothetical protein